MRDDPAATARQSLLSEARDPCAYE